jgi:glc operon protein GlcG
MTSSEITSLATQLIAEVEKLIPAAMQNPEDRDNSGGNVTLLIIAEGGQIFGRMFGDDNRTRRGTSRIAWQKCTQVWMTGQATGKFEKQVYGPHAADPGKFGLQHPDLIGWDGGLPVVASDGTKFAVAVSGFTGVTDCQIIRDAVKKIPALRMAE